MKTKDWRLMYPLNTFMNESTTYNELVAFIEALLQQKEDECKKGRSKEIMEAIKLSSLLKQQ